MRNVMETLIGAVVLFIAAGFMVFAYNSANLSVAKDSYTLYAKFEHADGLVVGSDVKIGGIKVGSVTEASLEPNTYLARVGVTLNKEIKLPKDSSAQIVSDGLLGAKYLAIVPGGDDNLLQANDEIKFTQSSVNLETLIGKLMFSGGGNKKQDDKGDDNETSTPEQPDSHHKEEAPSDKKMVPSLE